jgi:phosphotransferase system  glucose/maltose/N-acetylglucosamine-specific IIC component
MKNFFTPAICLAVVVPLTFLIIGPVATWLSQLLANGYQLIYRLRPGWPARRWARCGRCALSLACTGA